MIMIGSFSVMAEGGKGNVDDGKSTDGKKEKQFNYRRLRIYESHIFELRIKT